MSERCEAAKPGITHGSIFFLSSWQLPQPGQSSLLSTPGNPATHPFLQEQESLLGTSTTLFFPTQHDFKLRRRAEKAEPCNFHHSQAFTHHINTHQLTPDPQEKLSCAPFPSCITGILTNPNGLQEPMFAFVWKARVHLSVTANYNLRILWSLLHR